MSAARSNAEQHIAPCTLFKPSIFSKIAETDYRRFVSRELPASIKLPPTTHLADAISEQVLEANRTDPSILPERIYGAQRFSNLDQTHRSIGAAYFELCQLVPDVGYKDIFLLPFISAGGADKYINDVMHELYRKTPTEKSLVLLGERQPSGPSFKDRVSPNAHVVDLSETHLELDLHWRNLLSFKLIQNVAPQARVHTRNSPIGHDFLNRFSSLLPENKFIHYRFSDAMHLKGKSTYVRPEDFQCISKNLPYISVIISDNQYIIKEDERRIGCGAGKWKYLPAKHAAKTTLKQIAERHKATRGMALWASRLDAEKRPSVLIEIGRCLERSQSGIRLDVFGASVLGVSKNKLKKGGTVRYNGGFSSFYEINTSLHDCFVYTSYFDGMPNVLLEAAAVGLPLVAPDVGGIGDFVIDGETGILLPSLASDAEMAEQYCNAMMRLASNPGLRIKLASNALDLLLERYSPGVYTDTVRRIFDDDSANVSSEVREHQNGSRFSRATFNQTI